MALVKPAPEALGDMKRPQRDFMALAMANALVSAGRLRHKPALAEAQRILQLDPGNCPGTIRAAAAFAVGVLETPATQASASKFLQIYESQYEDHVTKFESLKALGNLRHAPSADRLKAIAEADATPDLRWMAHWAYERTAGVRVPYTPPTELREPPVTILDLAKN
jgi:hypothetical protein